MDFLFPTTVQCFLTEVRAGRTARLTTQNPQMCEREACRYVCSWLLLRIVQMKGYTSVPPKSTNGQAVSKREACTV